MPGLHPKWSRARAKLWQQLNHDQPAINSQGSGSAVTNPWPQAPNPCFSGRSGLVGPPLCGGSAPATPPLLNPPPQPVCGNMTLTTRCDRTSPHRAASPRPRPAGFNHNNRRSNHTNPRPPCGCPLPPPNPVRMCICSYAHDRPQPAGFNHNNRSSNHMNCNQSRNSQSPESPSFFAPLRVPSRTKVLQLPFPRVARRRPVRISSFN